MFRIVIEDEIRGELADWDLEDAFFLYQDKGREKCEDYIMRLFSFSKGLTKCWVIIGCFPQIEVISENINVTLLASISNILLSQLVEVLVSDWSPYKKLECISKVNEIDSRYKINFITPFFEKI